MMGASALGSAAGAWFAPSAHAASKIGSTRSRAGDDGSGDALGGADVGHSSASISGLGQLFSNLQQLHDQNPAEFTQVLSQIASTLRSAAQQQSGGAGQLLAQLAESLKQSAATGTMPESNRATGTEVQSYSRTGQPLTATAVPGVAAAPASGLPDLFKSLASQVGAALGA